VLSGEATNTNFTVFGFTRPGLFMLFNVTFDNILVISWWSILLVEETGENHRPAASH
jgi:hypothetical protein